MRARAAPLHREPRYARCMPYDLHLEPLDPAIQRATRRPVGWGYVPAVAVRGLRALVDQWMRILLTAKGSDPCDLNLGTSLIDLVGSNVSPRNAAEIAREAVSDCNAQVRQFQQRQRGKPADELLEDAVITKTVVDPAGPGLYVWVTITSQAGASDVVRLPDLVTVTGT